LVDCVCVLLMADWNVFCVAPSVAWKLLTCESAASIAVMAFCAPEVVEISTPETPRPAAFHVVEPKLAVIVWFADAPIWKFTLPRPPSTA
jgi:hypothetical protein